MNRVFGLIEAFFKHEYLAEDSNLVKLFRRQSCIHHIRKANLVLS